MQRIQKKQTFHRDKIMKLSKTAGYALVSVGYIAQHSQEGRVLASTISKHCNVKLSYLYKILLQLVKANILRGKRGPRGGFTLSRPAEDVTILEIIEAIEGPILDHIQLVEQTNNKSFILKMEKVCLSTTEKVRDLYSKAKLSDMLK